MQAAATFLIDLQRRGFTLRPEGDRIWVFPGERLTKAERNRVQRFKPDLLTLLSRQPAPRRAETVAPELWRYSNAITRVVISLGR